MNKLSAVFAQGKAFIPFITAGDPTLEVTEQLVYALADAGADLIEIGIPFSDPVAEGPIIQAADNRALANGTTTDKIFAMVENIRKTCAVPLAFMTYANPIFSYGADKFLSKCKEVAVEAIIVPDLPYEERGEFLPFCLKYNVTLISMIAPTSENRIQMIANEAEGFIYCVSSMGVTGVRQEIGGDMEAMIKMVKSTKDIPCAIGFGISTPEQAADMAKYADGVIVGSQIVKIVEEYGSGCIRPVVEYVRTMKDALK